MANDTKKKDKQSGAWQRAWMKRLLIIAIAFVFLTYRTKSRVLLSVSYVGLSATLLAVIILGIIWLFNSRKH